MPRRGEVWMVDLGMAQKTRPALILNTEYADADRDLVTVVAHSTSIRGSKFEVSIELPFLKPGAFVIQSVTTIPAKWALRRLGHLSTEQIAPIEEKMRLWLGL